MSHEQETAQTSLAEQFAGLIFKGVGKVIRTVFFLNATKEIATNQTKEGKAEQSRIKYAASWLNPLYYASFLNPMNLFRNLREVSLKKLFSALLFSTATNPVIDDSLAQALDALEPGAKKLLTPIIEKLLISPALANIQENISLLTTEQQAIFLKLFKEQEIQSALKETLAKAQAIVNEAQAQTQAILKEKQAEFANQAQSILSEKTQEFATQTQFSWRNYLNGVNLVHSLQNLWNTRGASVAETNETLLEASSKITTTTHDAISSIWSNASNKVMSLFQNVTATAATDEPIFAENIYATPSEQAHHWIFDKLSEYGITFNATQTGQTVVDTLENVDNYVNNAAQYRDNAIHTFTDNLPPLSDIYTKIESATNTTGNVLGLVNDFVRDLSKEAGCSPSTLYAGGAAVGLCFGYLAFRGLTSCWPWSSQTQTVNQKVDNSNSNTNTTTVVINQAKPTT